MAFEKQSISFPSHLQTVEQKIIIWQPWKTTRTNHNKDHPPTFPTIKPHICDFACLTLMNMNHKKTFFPTKNLWPFMTFYSVSNEKKHTTSATAFSSAKLRRVELRETFQQKGEVQVCQPFGNFVTTNCFLGWWTHWSWKTLLFCWLVVEPPIKKYARQIRVKITNVWNHHLVLDDEGWKTPRA